MKHELRRREQRGRGLGECLGALLFSPWLESALVFALTAYLLAERVLRNVYRFQNYYYISTLLGLALLVVVLGRLREQKRSAPPELWLLGGNAVWMVFTRLWLGHMKINMSNEGPTFWALMCVALFALAFYLEGKRRERLLDVLFTFFIAVHLVLSVLGILTVFLGDLPVVSQVVKMGAEGTAYGEPLIYIYCFRVHRNLAAGYFFAAMALAVYQFQRHRTPFWRWAAAACVPVFYVIIALQHCRSIFLTSSAYLALVVGMAVQDRLARRSVWLRIVCVGLVGAVCTVVLFAGYSRCSEAVAALAESLAERRALVLTPSETSAAEEQVLQAELAASAEQTEAAAEQPAAAEAVPAEQPEEKIQLNDNRDTLEDARTLTGRTDIWRAMVTAIQKHHRIAVLGTDEEKMMKIIHRYGPEEEKAHMHHVLFQQLMTAGVPSFLFCLGYLLLLIIRAVRGYLALGVEAAERRGLSVFLLPLLIYGCFEPLMCQHTKVMTLVLMLCSGLLARQDAGARESEAEKT